MDIRVIFHADSKPIEKASDKLDDMATSGEKAGEGIKKGMKGADKSVSLLGQSLKGVKGLLGTLGLATILTAGVASNLAYANSLAEVSTLVETTSFNMDGLSKSALEQANVFGSSPTAQVKSYYQIISAGASTAAEATDTLTAANKLAVGGVTDITTAADGLTSVLNAYGDGVKSAEAVSDSMFIAMKAGKTTIAELSNNIGNVAPLAAQAGVGFDELLASTAALTKGGMSTSIAMNGLKGIVSAIVKPSSEAAKEAKKLGIDFSAAGLESKGFAGFLEDLKAKTGGSTESMAKLFGGVEALTPVLALTGKASGDFANTLDAMKDKAGATQEAFDKMANSPGFQISRIINGISAAFVSLGSNAIPVVVPLLKSLADGIGFLSDNMGIIVGLAAVLASVLLARSAPAMLAMAGRTYTAVTSLAAYAVRAGLASVASGGLGNAALRAGNMIKLAFMANPLGVLLVAITSTIVAFSIFKDKTLTIGKTTASVGEWMSATWDVVKESFDGLQKFMGDAWSNLTKYLGKNDVWQSITGFMGSVLGFARKVVNGMIGHWVGGYRAIKAAFNNLPEFFTELGKSMLSGMGNALSAGMNKIISGLNKTLDFFGFEKKITPFKIDLPTGDISKAKTALKSIGSAYASAFKVDYIGKAGRAIKATFEEAKDIAFEAIEPIARRANTLHQLNTSAARNAANAAQEQSAAQVKTQAQMDELIKKSEGAVSAVKKLKGHSAGLAKTSSNLADKLTEQANKLGKTGLEALRTGSAFKKLSATDQARAIAAQKSIDASKLSAVALKQENKVISEQEKLHDSALKSRNDALETMERQRKSWKLGFPLIKDLTTAESKKFDLDKKAFELAKKAQEMREKITSDIKKRVAQVAALVAISALSANAIAVETIKLEGYTTAQANARIADEKQLNGLKKIAEINDNLQIQTVRRDQGDEAARLLELSKQYGAEQAKIIQQKEQQLRYTDQEIAAWDTVKNAIADVFHTGELKWNNLRDALLKPLTLDVNLKINKAAGDITRSIKSVFSKGGGFGDLIKTVKDSVGGLFKGTGKGIGGAINSYQIGSGLAGALGANPAGQMGAGIGAALGSFMPGIGSAIGSVVGGLIGNLFSSNPKIRFNQSFEKGQTAENWNDGRNYEGKSVFGRFGLDRASKRFYKLSDAAKDATEKMVRVAEFADSKIAELMTAGQIDAAKAALSNKNIQYGNNEADIKAFLLTRLNTQLEQLSPALRATIKATGDYEHQLQALADVVDIKKTVLPLFEDLGAEIGKSAQTILTEFKNNDFLSAWVEQFPEDALAEAERQAQDARLAIIYKWGEKLKQEGESVSQALIRSAGNFAAVTTMADNMGISSSTASLKGLELSNQLIELAGGLNEFGSKAEYVYQNFFTQAERDLKAKENATSAIAAYNEEFSGLDITSRDTFRTIIDSIDLTTEAGVKQYAALLDVAQSVDTLYPKLKEAEAAITDVSSAITLFNQEFYSSAEQAAQKLADAQATLANADLDLGGMDNIREKFRTLIESLDPGSDAYNNAIQYAQAIDIIADAQEDAARKLAEATQNYESYFLGTNHSLDEARAIVAGLGLSVDDLKNSYIALVNGATGAERERLISLNESVRLVIEEENRLKEARIRAAEEAAREQARLAEELAREQQRIYEEHKRALERVADLTRELADLQAQLASLEQRIAGGGTSAEEVIQAQIEAQQIVVSQARDSVTAAQNAYNEAMRYWEAQQKAAQAGREYLESLKLDNNLTNLTPQEQLAEAQRQYQEALASGDVGATQSAMQKYLQLARAAYGSSDQYDQILNLTRGSFEDLLASIENQPQPSDDILNTARANLQAAEDQLAVLREQLELARETARTEDLEAQRADLAAKIQAKMDELKLAEEASNATITPNLQTLKNTHETNYADIIHKLAQQITIDTALPADIRDHLTANLTAIRNATDNTTLTAATQTMRDYINSLPDDIKTQLDPRLINLIAIKEGTAKESNHTTAWYVEAIARRTKSTMFNIAELLRWFTGIDPHRFADSDIRFGSNLNLNQGWTSGGGGDASATNQTTMIDYLAIIANELTTQKNLAAQNDNWAGGAIPKFAMGGIAIGPKSGYLAELHGMEAVVPVPSGEIPVRIKAPMVQQKNKEQEKTNKLLEASLKQLEEIKRENQELRKDVNQLRSERAKSASNAEKQRDTHITATKEADYNNQKSKHFEKQVTAL